MIKIMFVCHGNICRSPMAEFIMKDIVNKENLSDSFVISSSATSSEEIWHGKGNPIYPPAREELEKHNIKYDINKTATQLHKSDYDKYDYFLLMDENNIRNIKRIFNDDSNKKIYKLLYFSGTCRDVIDPWYTGDFNKAYIDIKMGCEAFIQWLKEKGDIN